MKKKSKIDVAVLITFFARPETLEKVFESVREARPSTLLLWQDGPREGRMDDVEKIQKCRKIVENIDWECTVYTNYHKKNMGCDPSTFLAQKWAFEIVDKCIIMEDDRIPAPSFYRYCKELLDKYEHDERINHICGTNLLGTYEDCPNDYFFAPFGSTTWASWRRVAKQWDEAYSYLRDDYTLSCLKSIVGKDMYDILLKNARKHAASGFQWWETILGMGCMLNNRLAIIPQKNMITDIGMTKDSTHATADSKLVSKSARKMFNMRAFDLGFPLKHPDYVLPDYNYVKRLSYISGTGMPFLRFRRKVAYLGRCIYYGEFKRLFKGLKKHRK